MPGTTLTTPGNGQDASPPGSGDPPGIYALDAGNMTLSPPAMPAESGTAVDLGGVCPVDGGSLDASGGDPVACGCTRRPAPSDSSECPAGAGEFISMVVGYGATLPLSGRMYAVSGVNAQIAIPPTAIPSYTTVTMTETAIPPPHDLLDWSPVYRVDPVGLMLDARAQVQFPWSNTSDTAGLTLWFSPDGSCFTRVSDSYGNAGFQTGSTTQLGYFIVGVERTSPTAACP